MYFGQSASIPVNFNISAVDGTSQSFQVSVNYGGAYSSLSSTSAGSFSSPSPFPAVSQSDLAFLNKGEAPPDFAGATVTTGQSVSLPAGTFTTDEISLQGGGTMWVDSKSGLIIKSEGVTGLLGNLPAFTGTTFELQKTNIATSSSSNNLFLTIIAIVAILVVAGGGLFYYRRRKGALTPMTSSSTSTMQATTARTISENDPRVLKLRQMLQQGLITQQDYDEQMKRLGR
jgi:LPXTG-motif cell wall-anchored protein